MQDLNDIDLVQLLINVPEYKPRIIALAWEIVEDGEIVPQKAGLMSKEITEAIDEAQDNTQVIRELTQCLLTLALS